MIWLKENWFKLSIVILSVILVATYVYDVWERHHPYKTFKEEFKEDLQKGIDEGCREGKASISECLFID